MLTDFTKCVGCRSCEEACNKEHGLPKPAQPFNDEGVFNEERKPSASAYTVVNRHENPDDPDKPIYRKIQCNHCLEPACATACPIHAYTKTPEGAVIYDKDLCFGCRYCMIACPFYMPAYDYDSAFEPKIVKCVMCHDRLREGRAPACAEACPMGAVTFGKRDKLLRMARHRIEDEPERYISHIYGEHEAGGTSWLYLSSVPFTELGFPEGVPEKPMIELTRNYLDSVPMVFTAWPAIFGLVYGAMRSKEKKQKEPDADVQSDGR
jgi:Fe-S-cluster-containing dehydrogenase component